MKRDIIVNIGTSIWLFLFYYLGSKGESTVLLLMHNSSLVCVGCFFYYLIFLLLKMCMPRYFGGNYTFLEDIESGKTQMTVMRVSNVVYGMGSIFYISCYCFTMKNLICTFYFCMGLSIVCICSDLNEIKKRIAIMFFTLLALFCGVGIGNFQLYIEQILDASFTVLLWETIIPFFTVFSFFGFKCKEKHCSLFEIFEFGIPIMFMLGVIFFLIEESFLLECGDFGNRLKLTDFYSLFLTPFCFFPLLMYTIHMFFNDKILDLLIGIGTVVNLVHLANNEIDWLFVMGGLNIFLATIFRIVLE